MKSIKKYNSGGANNDPKKGSTTTTQAKPVELTKPSGGTKTNDPGFKDKAPKPATTNDPGFKEPKNKENKSILDDYKTPYKKGGAVTALNKVQEMYSKKKK